jgi:lipid-binding SYLF domain-containing protein
MHAVKKPRLLLPTGAVLVLLVGAPARADSSKVEKLWPDVEQARARFIQADPDIAQLLRSSAGYAVFPRIGKGGLIVGGASGSGLLFDGSQVVGVVRVSQLTIGAPAGGQVYSQLILLQDKPTLERFEKGHFEMSAQASGVVAATGAAKSARYTSGAMTFILPARAGYMGEASIGRQTFTLKGLPPPLLLPPPPPPPPPPQTQRRG